MATIEALAAEVRELRAQMDTLVRGGLEGVRVHGLFQPVSETYAGDRKVAARADHETLFSSLMVNATTALGNGALRQYLRSAYSTLVPTWTTDHVYKASDFGISSSVVDNYDRLSNALARLVSDGTGTLEFADETINYSGALTIPTGSYICLKGTIGSILKQQNLGVSALSIGNATTSMTQVHIVGLSFDAAGAMTAGAVLDLQNIVGLFVDQVSITRGMIGIRYLESLSGMGFLRFNRIDMASLTATDGIGWDIGGGTSGPAYTWIDQCTATATGASGIRLRAAAGTYITGGTNIGTFAKNLHLVVDAGATIRDTFIETGIFDSAAGVTPANIYLDATSGGNIHRTAMSNGWATTSGDANIAIVEGAGQIIDFRLTNSYVIGATGHGIYVNDFTNDIVISNTDIASNAGDGVKVDAGNTGRIILLGNTIIGNTGWGVNNQGVVSVAGDNTFASNTAGNWTGNNAIAAAGNVGLTAAQETYIRQDLGTTAGDTLYYTAASTPARRAIGAINSFYTSDGAAPQWSSAAAAAALLDHNALTNLAVGDVHTLLALLAGRSGGQTLTGGTAASNNLNLRSTSHATKGRIYLGANDVVFFDEPTDSWNLGSAAVLTPDVNIPLQIIKNANGNVRLDLQNLSAGASSIAALRLLNDTSAVILQMRAMSSNASVTRFGYTMANSAELIANGASLVRFVIGTSTADPVMLGTNNVERILLRSTGGILIHPETGATPNVTLSLEGSGDRTLWVSSDADGTTSPAGIFFGASADTNLYRNAVSSLKTDDDFVGALSIKSISPTSGVGYGTGAGGTVTQLTNKATTVVLNKVCGKITTSSAALAADTTVSFTMTNSAIAGTDVLALNVIAGAVTPNSYHVDAVAGAGNAIINIRNITAGSLSEAIDIAFAVIKAVQS